MNIVEILDVQLKACNGNLTMEIFWKRLSPCPFPKKEEVNKENMKKNLMQTIE
jgi:hypothetical protein